MPHQGGRGLPRAVRRIGALGAALALIAAALMIGGPALAAPPAPAPTSTEQSPSAPDPNPPLGGLDAAGRVVGGDQLLSRGLLQPPGSPPLPDGIGAAAFVLADLDSGDILAARDAHGRYQPASILKFLTALVLLPSLPGDQRITPSAAAAGAEGSAVGIVPGGTYTADQLFTGMMLMSGNDATMALAEAAGGADAVVAQMNSAIAQLGGVDTLVETPSGLDGWKQLTSAYDMALVLRQAALSPRLVAYDQQQTGELAAQSVAGKQYGPIPLANQGWQFHDEVPGAGLVKSGYTDAARNTYLATAQRGDHRYGVVFLRNERTPVDQWKQAGALIDWAAALPAGTPAVGRLVEPSSPLPSAAPNVAATSIAATAAPTPTPTATPTPSPTPTPTAAASGTAPTSAAPTATAGIVRAGAAGSAPPHGSAVGSTLYALGVAAAAVVVGVVAAAGISRRRARLRGPAPSRSAPSRPVPRR